MSGLLAGELARGSLDFLASTPAGSGPRRAREARRLPARAAPDDRAVRRRRVRLDHGVRDAARRRGRVRRRPRARGVAVRRGARPRARSPSRSRRSSAAVAALAVGGIALFASFIVSGYASIAVRAPAPRAVVLLLDHRRPPADRRRVGLAGRGRGRRRRGRPARLRRRGVRAARPPRPDGRSGPLPDAADLPRRARSPARSASACPRRSSGALALGLFGLIISFSVDEFVATLSSIPEIVDLIQRVLPRRRHPLGRRVPAAGLLLRGDPDREHRRRRRSLAAGRPTRATGDWSCSCRRRSAGRAGPSRAAWPSWPGSRS